MREGSIEREAKQAIRSAKLIPRRCCNVSVMYKQLISGQTAVIPSERVQIWVCSLSLVLQRREATNVGVFDLCHFAPLKPGCANSVVF